MWLALAQLQSWTLSFLSQGLKPDEKAIEGRHWTTFSSCCMKTYWLQWKCFHQFEVWAEGKSMYFWLPCCVLSRGVYCSSTDSSTVLMGVRFKGGRTRSIARVAPPQTHWDKPPPDIRADRQLDGYHLTLMGQAIASLPRSLSPGFDLPASFILTLDRD